MTTNNPNGTKNLYYLNLVGLFIFIGILPLNCSTRDVGSLDVRNLREPVLKHAWEEIERSDQNNSHSWISYSKEVNGSKFKAFKIKGIISASPIEAIEALRYRLEQWTDFYTEKEAYFEILESDSDSLLVYSIFKLPFPFRDRSMCEKFKIKQDPSTGVHQITWQQEWEKAPAEQNIIRMPVAQGSWTFEPMDSTKSLAIYEVYTEPGGNLPAWMYNSTVKKGLPKELADINFIVEKYIRKESSNE